jgi:glycosyltransferase involved in cell wall biosynthesis
MIDLVRVIVVVPAYREERQIGRVLATLPASVDAAIVVDDGSPDGTADEVLRAAAGDPRVRLVKNARNLGVGATIARGYREACQLFPFERAALVVLAGDGQMSPDDLPRVVAPIASGEADYVKGNRFALAGVSAMPLGRRLGGRVFSHLTALATGLPIGDSQCGYTALDRDALTRLDLDDLWPGFGYPNDLLGQLAARGMRVVEVPVATIYGDESSKLGVRHLPRIGWLVGRAYVRRKVAGR